MHCSLKVGTYRKDDILFCKYLKSVVGFALAVNAIHIVSVWMPL